MTAAEKAKELVSKYYTITFIDYDGHLCNETLSHGAAKQCALIAVDEILETIENIHKPEYVSFDIYEPRKFHLEGSESEDNLNGYEMKEFFEQVKAEIEKL